MKRFIYYLILPWLLVGVLQAQNPVTISMPLQQPTPPNNALPTHTRAVTKINLTAGNATTPGFKYGFVSGGAQGLLNLSIGTYPGNISSAYLDTLSGNNPTVANTNLTLGTTDGIGEVTPYGSFSYQIPINCSPGTGGVQPNIAIAYNSNGGNGMLGLGFNLSGLSAIVRTNKTVFFDTRNDGINFNTSDVFAIDGERLLNATGTYGQNGATYRTEVENHKIITSFGTIGSAPQYFIINTPDGMTMEFGNTNDARLMDVNNTDVLAWYVNKISDVYGNYMTFSYNNSNGECVIEKIEYTGNTNAGLAPYNKILFNYFNRSDSRDAYIKGKLFKQTKLLKDITCLDMNGQLVHKYVLDYQYSFNSLLSKITEIDADGNQLNPTYFDWSKSQFYRSSSNGPLYIPSNSQVASYKQSSYNFSNVLMTVAVDFDGDGKKELAAIKNDGVFNPIYVDIYKNTATGTSTGVRNDFVIEPISAFDPLEKNEIAPNMNNNPEIPNVSVMDQNKDGKEELVVYLKYGSSYEILKLALLPNGKYTFLPRIGNTIPLYSSTTDSWRKSGIVHRESNVPLLSRSSYVYDWVDLTGDNQPDQVMIDPTGINITIAGASAYPFIPVNNAIKTKFGDFDGDGVADIYVLRTNDVNCALDSFLMKDVVVEVYKYNSQSNTFNIATSENFNLNIETTVKFCSPVYITKFFELNSNALDFGDFNGDGKTDIVYNVYGNKYTFPNPQPTNATSFVKYSTGTAFVSAGHIGIVNPKINGLEAAFFAGDINNDGLCDWGASAYDTTNYKSFFTYYPSTGNNSLANPPVVYNRINQYAGTMGDFDGDGTLDYFGQRNQNEVVGIEYNVFNQPNKRMLSRVYNLRSDYKIEYSLLQDRKAEDGHYLYKKTTGSYSPNFKVLNMPLFVVNRTKQNTIETKYAYENAFIHQLAKGFIGFEKMYAYNVNSGLLNETKYTYHPTQDYIQSIETRGGLPVNTPGFFVLSSTGITNKSTVNFGFTVLSGKRYLQSMQNVSKDYLKSTHFTSTILYDINQAGQVVSKTEAGVNWAGTTVLNGNTSSFQYQTLTHPVNGSTFYRMIKATTTKQGFVNGTNASSTYDTDFTYDAQGRMTQKVENSNISGSQITTNYSQFNAFGTPTQIDLSAPDLPQNRSKTLVIDNTGRFTLGITNAIGQKDACVFEPKYGSKIAYTDISGLTTQMKYDGMGRLIKTTLPSGAINITKYEWQSYNLPNNPQTFYGAKITGKPEGSPQVVKSFDNSNNLVETITEVFGGQQQVVKMTYNNLNQLILEEELPTINPQAGTLSKSYTFDAYLRPLIITSKMNGNTLNSVTYNYNPLSTDASQVKGFVRSATQTSNSNEIFYVRKENNSAGQQDIVLNWSSTNQSQQKSIINYNQYNAPFQIINDHNGGALAVNITTTFAYDALGRQISLNDPSAGLMTYNYNSIGELLSQQTPNGTFAFTYDQLGRMLTKSNNAATPLVYTYQYETAPQGRGQVKKIIGNDVTTEFSYDALNRLVEKKNTLTTSGNKVFKTNYGYDKYGRETNHTYPSGFVTNNEYDAIGNLVRIKNNNTNIWELNSLYAPGLIEQYTYGNGMVNSNVYDANQNLQQVNYGNLLQLDYNFSPKNGDLLNRSLLEVSSNITNNEKFEYDDYDRLTNVKYIDANQNTQLRQFTNYNANGNIANKSDAGTYVYGQANKPYQLTQITGANTSNISVNTLDVTYNTFRKVEKIMESTSNKQFDFVYGNAEERVKMAFKIGGVLQYTRYYDEDYDLQETNTGYTSWTYIQAPTGLAAIWREQNGSGQLMYVSSDHLGSPVALIDDTPAQTILEQYSFDAWGRRRDPNNWNSYIVPSNNLLIRGYTMHEMLDEVSIINMNGRIYDPVLGRFLQPDNYVQSQFDLQTFNRYVYAHNNPLKYTDPDGNNPLAVAAVLGAVMGGVQGYMIGKANGATGWELFGYTMAGAGIGALVGLAGGAIAGSATSFAGTSSVAFSSAMSSAAFSTLNGGKSDIVVNFGAASYNADKGEWGYLFKKGNSALENVGYGFGAMANIQDIVAGTNGSKVDISARKKLWGHSEGSCDGYGCVSVAPIDGQVSNDISKQSKWELEFLKMQLRGRAADGINESIILPQDPQFTTTVYNVNKNLWAKASYNLNNGRNLTNTGRLIYGFNYGCINNTSRALLLSGSINVTAFLPIAPPLLLNLEYGLRQSGTYSYLVTGFK
jgi:RHS repeat-associated protein